MAAEVEVKKDNFLENAREYLGDIRSEMKRVTWPSREQVQSTTVVVILSVFIFALYFKIIDQVIQSTVVKLSEYLTK
jgi:preprotein translocase subunit SecE